jgi:tol-pal system protein YbgF
MQKLRLIICTGLISSLCILPTAFANAPVVDLNGDDQAADRSSLSVEQRLNLLEQQVSNITQMNLPGKIDSLEQQVQQLNGQLEVQTHSVEALTEDQKKFYQDLDQRLTALKTLVDKGGVTAEGSKSSKATAAVLPTDVSASPNEEKAYQTAFNLLVSKQYDKAITAFQKFLTNYPNGKYAGNAHYWLGEMYTTQNKNDLASTEFTTLITKYPKNAKASDAMLKIAIIHDQAGKHDQAKQELQKVVKQYPGTSAARLASMRLQEMKT